MTNATVNDFFGGNLEEEILDVVVLNAITDTKGTGNYTFPNSFRTSDFDRIEIQWSRDAYEEVVATSILNSGQISAGYGACSATFFDGATTHAVTAEFPPNSTTWSVNVYYSTLRVRQVLGFRRRIASVGLDELMSSMGMPNLILNPDLDSPVNQRAFNGTWSSLAVGAYGYDQWVKTSATHMGYVIEEGKYIPNKKHTLTVDGAVKTTIMSPASGHFVVSVPFATSGKYDLYAGEFKRPWHPPVDASKDCSRHYLVTQGYYVSYGVSGASLQRTSVYYSEMRSNPAITLARTSGQMNASLGAINKTHCVLSFSSTAASQEWSGNVVCDASIPWSEVSSKVIVAY